MSDSKHTPGPWTAGRSDMATLVEGYRSKWIYAGEKYIAAASGMQVDEWDEVVANARLIAAAPELLAALEEVLRHAKYADNTKSEDERDAMFARAEAAIRKAKGEL